MTQGGDGVGKALDGLDDALQTKVRLGIMTLLSAWGEGTFPALKEELDLTDGNLSSHLRVLEEKGYVKIEKSFAGRRPRTACRPTKRGLAALQRHLDGLESMIRTAREG